MKINLNELKEKAKAATPGPWSVGDISSEWDTPTVLSSNGGYLARTTHYGKMRDDASFIASCNPQTVLTLIEDLERAKEALKFYASKEFMMATKDGIGIYSVVFGSEGKFVAQKALSGMKTE